MCWTTRKLPVKQIAEKDITVYKILEACYDFIDSPICPYSWELNKLYTSNLDIPSINLDNPKYFIIEQGFHTIMIIPKLHKEITNESPFPYYINTINNSIILYKIPNRHIYECTIPKGAAYYVNEELLVVSDKLIINKRIEDVLDR